MCVCACVSVPLIRRWYVLYAFRRSDYPFYSVHMICSSTVTFPPGSHRRGHIHWGLFLLFLFLFCPTFLLRCLPPFMSRVGSGCLFPSSTAVLVSKFVVRPVRSSFNTPSSQIFFSFLGAGNDSRTFDVGSLVPYSSRRQGREESMSTTHMNHPSSANCHRSAYRELASTTHFAPMRWVWHPPNLSHWIGAVFLAGGRLAGAGALAVPAVLRAEWL